MGVALLFVSMSLAGAREVRGEGGAVGGVEAYDRVIPRLLREWRIPGGAVAVAAGGRIVLARGYGRTARRGGRAVEAETRFRIASVSKPITAVAVLRLVEEGRLALDEPVWPHLDHLEVPDPTRLDPRWKQITVRQLLQHRGGWDRDRSFDPMFEHERVSRALGTGRPPTRSDVVRFMMTRGFEHEPGSVYAYSNFGYAVLGEVIESVSGRPYEAYVREAVLEPMGVPGMRIGATRAEELGADEPRYEDFRGARLLPSLFPEGPSRLPAPLGGSFQLGTLDAHGGWVASAPELVRFALHVDGRSEPEDVLRTATLEAMRARPDADDVRESPTWYALGWSVRAVAQGTNWWHTGSLPGTTALLVGTHHGYAWAALCNSRPRRWAEFNRALDEAMWEAFRQVEWPRAK